MNRLLIILLFFISSNVHSQTIIFHDAFDDNDRKWFSGKNDSLDFRIDSGYYHIQSRGTVESQPLDSTLTHAFYASCTGRMESGAKGASYGFFLQEYEKGIDRKVFFIINPAGLYSVFMQKPDGTVPLSKWTSSPYILQGNEFNTLAINGDSTRLNIYINDFYVNSYDNPVHNYNYTGVASFDTSKVEFDELFVFSYPKMEKKFNIDVYNFPEVLNYLLDAQPNGFKEMRGKTIHYGDSSLNFYESKLWVPGAKETFLTDKTYSAVFGSFTTVGEANTFLYSLYEKIKVAFPESRETMGYDELKTPYYIIGRTKSGDLIKPYLDLYISEQDGEEGKQVYSVVIDIE